MKHLFLGLALTALAAGAQAAPLTFACKGPQADEGRKVAKADDLKLGQHPQACFTKADVYGYSSKPQIIVAAPSPACPGALAFDVYERSRIGSYFNLFKQPTCGKTFSLGPKDPWGSGTVLIDNRRYREMGGEFIPFK